MLIYCQSINKYLMPYGASSLLPPITYEHYKAGGRSLETNMQASGIGQKKEAKWDWKNDVNG
jgi:hypothetical protein